MTEEGWGFGNDRGGAGPEVTGEEAGRGVMGCRRLEVTGEEAGLWSDQVRVLE